LKYEPTEKDLWFLLLGVTGEIGMNINLYGHNGQWQMIDCGVRFFTNHP
jgi:ribonuclease J